MPSVLDQVDQLESTAAEDAATKFDQLVRSVSSDKPADPATIATTLRAIGKTAGDLRSAVDNRNKRKRLLDEITAGQRAAEEIAGIDRKFQDAQAKLQAANDAYAETVQPLGWRRQELAQVQMRAASAQRELRDSADKRLHDALKSKQRMFDQYHKELRQWEGYYAEAAEKHKHALASGNELDANAIAHRMEGHKAKADEVRPKVDEYRQEIAALEAKLLEL